MPVIVFNGRADENQKLFSVYLVDGRVTKDEIEQARRNGECIIDFVGRIETQRDRRGRPMGRRTKGVGKKDVMTGDAVFVRPARPGEPPDQEFWVRSMSSHEPPRALREPILVEIDPADVSSVDIRMSSSAEPAATPMPVRIPVDPVTGNPIDNIASDGSVGFSADAHDHVVLVLETPGRVLKGSKGDMLADGAGILATLEREMPEQREMCEKARAAIEALDPSAEMLVISLPEVRVTAIPRNAFPEVS